MTSPFPQITSPPQALAEVVVNEAFETLEHQAVYGKKQSTTSGLTWGYYGGRWGGFSVAAGTFTLTGSTTNYIVVAIATGVTSAATTATNWNDSTNYARVYKLTTDVSTVTAEEDHRGGPGGIAGGAGSGTSFTGGTLTSALNEAPTVTIASASTVNIGAAAANSIIISGGATINAFDTIAAGVRRLLVFSGTPVLTHNATSLINPTGASITVVAGDTAEVVSLGSGNWRVTSYQRKDGTALASSSATLSHPINSQTGTSYAFLSTDNAKHVTTSNASSIAATIAQAGTTGFLDGYFFFWENIGAGTATLTPSSSQINGAATLVLNSGMAAVVFSDGTNYRAFVFDPAGVTVNLQTGTSYTVLSGDRGKLVSISNASAIAVTLPQATGAFGSKWFSWIQNVGAGTATITPTTSTIDGLTSLALLTGQGVLLASDGANYYTVRGLSASGGSLTNWTEANASASPNNIVPVVSFTATNAATNVDAALLPKGTGSILSAIPDSGSTNGNKRGIRSVDLQMKRSAATHVASGQQSGLLAGDGNIASGNQATCVGGASNVASGTNSFAGGGNGHTVSGLHAAAVGGNLNIVSGDYSSVVGGVSASTRGLLSVAAAAAGQFLVEGDSQWARYIGRVLTTNATVTAATADGNSAGATNTIVMPNNSAYCGRSRVVARSGTTDQAMFDLTWAAIRGVNAASTAILGTPTTTVIAASGGAGAWTVTAVANTTNGSVDIKVTGAAATNIKWAVVTDTTEVTN